MNIEKLYNDYQKIIYSFVFKKVQDVELAEDITQTTFVRAYERFSQYQSDKEILSWLFGIAQYAIIDHYRSKYSSTTIYKSLDELVDENNTYNPEFYTLNQELKHQLESAFRTLTKAQKDAFKLRFIDDLDSYESAKKLNINLNAYLSRVLSAKNRCKRFLERTR